MSTPTPGTTLAERYVVIAPLGEGGMGQVVRARDTKLDREVAVKLLAAHAIGNAKARERLLREASAAAKLSHAGIVHVYDVGETPDGGAFLVMELVRGESLRARIERGPRPAAEALRIVVACARALAFAHRAGCVHRDVKPDNVMIRDDGRAALLDFGIAKTVAARAPELTDEGMVVGTPAYLAPEQARGEDIDGRADQFALAVTLYEALTGRSPWAATSAAAVVAEILRDEPPAPSTVAPSLPPALDAVIARAMKKRAADRYADLDAFADALEEILAALGTTPAELPASLARTEAMPTPASQVAPVAPRAGVRWSWVAGGLGLVALGAAVVVPRALAQHAAPAAPSASAPAPSAVPTAVTDLPLPPSTNQEAIAAYRAGMQATRDGNGEAMARNFKRAGELDPSMAAAHFRYANIAFAFGHSAEAREALNRAIAQRSMLSPRDLAMVEAEEALILRPEPDLAEYRRLAHALADAYPMDADARASAAGSSLLAGDSVAAEAEARRAIELDPRSGVSWLVVAFSFDRRGQPEKAREAYTSCLHASPDATTCLSALMIIEDANGDCTSYDAHATQLFALDPEARNSTAKRAVVLARAQAPSDTLRAALSAYGRTFAQQRLGALDATDTYDLWEGDFAELVARRGERDAVLADVSDRSEQAGAAYSLVTALHEIGRDAEAGKVALDFTSRLALLSGSQVMQHGLYDDSSLVLAAARAYRAVDRVRGAKLREDGLAAGASAGSTTNADIAWLSFYAEGAVGRDDAEAALRRMPLGFADRHDPLGAARRADGLGHMYALLERWDDAVPVLERGVAACDLFHSIPLLVRAHVELAQGYAAKGEPARACEQHRWVLDLWGGARPRSVTAEASRQSMRSLGCKP